MVWFHPAQWIHYGYTQNIWRDCTVPLSENEALVAHFTMNAQAYCKLKGETNQIKQTLQTVYFNWGRKTERAEIYSSRSKLIWGTFSKEAIWPDYLFQALWSASGFDPLPTELCVKANQTKLRGKQGRTLLLKQPQFNSNGCQFLTYKTKN